MLRSAPPLGSPDVPEVPACYDGEKRNRQGLQHPTNKTEHSHAPKTSSRPHAASEAAFRCSPTTKHVRLGKELKVMYKPISKSDASDSARSAHEALLALYEVIARYNASIRVKYPPSAPIVRVMERNTSSWPPQARCRRCDLRTTG